MAELPVYEHLHLPVQAGINRILRRMNRGYTREYYPNSWRRYACCAGYQPDHRPHCWFSGRRMRTCRYFRPGEAVRFDSAFTFIYSPRKGTLLPRWLTRSRKVKKERIYRLIDLQNQISAEHMQNTPRPRARSAGGRYLQLWTTVGRTRRQVHFAGESSLIGQLAKVRIVNFHFQSKGSSSNKDFPCG